jgi:hypothetical protein
MRRMRGEEEAEVAFGAVIFVIAVGMVFGIIIINFTDFTATVTTSQKDITSIYEAHRLAACFESKGLTEGLIQNNAELNKCKKSYSFCLWDMETGKKSSGCGGSSWIHTVYINIMSGNQVNMGGLSVKE